MKDTWFFNTFLKPRTLDEDTRRKEFILNILLIGSIALSGVATLLVNHEILIMGAEYRGAPFRMIFGVFMIFTSLYVLSRQGFWMIGTYTLVSLYLVSAGYSLYRWGVDLPTGLLIFTLVILLSGILVNLRFLLAITLVSAIAFVLLAYAQIHNLISLNSYWRDEPLQMGNVAIIIGIFCIAAVVSWLSNREIEESLHRARKSEKALLQERDKLEEKIEERTRQLKKAQMERIVDLYHQADFGRLAIGLLHDLVTPLNVVSLNLEQLSASPLDSAHMHQTIERAMRGAKSMEHFVETVRKQIHQKETVSFFSPLHEIKQVIWLMSASAKEASVHIQCENSSSIKQLWGNPVKFQQMMINLITNAIAACAEKAKHQKITIRIDDIPHALRIIVEDTGKGISSEDLPRIFEPFFTTKAKSTGIGLTITRDIAMKEFKGSITVKSDIGIGTAFFVIIPLEDKT